MGVFPAQEFLNGILTYMADDPALYDGAHVAVQLVGRRLQEEKVLALTEHVGNVIEEMEKAHPSL